MDEYIKAYIIATKIRKNDQTLSDKFHEQKSIGDIKKIKKEPPIILFGSARLLLSRIDYRR